MKRVWYGSLQNRLEEGKQFVDEIKVGTGVTEYYYSDREPYEVIAVEDQKHITIRRLDAKRVDNNGMSDCQDYEFYSNDEYYGIDLVKRGDYWYSTTEMTGEDLAKLDTLRIKDKLEAEDVNFMMWASQFDHDKVRAKGKQTKFHRMNISIGRASKHYDYSF